METIFSNDEILINQLKSIEITSRVKDPYSLWRKILKLRVNEIEEGKNHRKTKKMVAVSTDLEPDVEQSSHSSPIPSTQNDESSLSILNIPDAIALRVVIDLQESSSFEDCETRKSRERLLCYYIQKLCTDIWPPSDLNRMKDYIRHPKPNGYQSLHYTTGIFCYGEYWPFELQVSAKIYVIY